jgi:oligopeptide transport system substrate-binding protein
MKKHKSVVIYTILNFLVALSLFVFSPKDLESRENPVFGGIYRRPLEFCPKILDPALSTDSYAVTVIQQVFDGLVQFDKNLNVVPAIAKSWKISPDGLTYIFNLRNGVTFHNGREVVAGDFVYSFARILDPATRSSSSDFFSEILGAKEFLEKKTKEVRGLVAENKYTLRIVLAKPYAPFLSILATKGAKVIPKEEVERSAPGFGKFPVGTGPFKFVSMKEETEIVLEANGNYFEGRPYLDKVIFKIFHGSPREEIFLRFKGEELEESFIPFDEVEGVLKSKRYILLQKPILSLRMYAMNFQMEPLRKPEVRRAIGLAVPKEEIGKEVLKGIGLLTDQIIPLGMPGYKPIMASLKYHPQRASELLRKAGYPDGKGIPSIELWSAAKSALAVKEMELIKTSLSRIGIHLNIRYEVQWPKFQELLSSKKAPIFMRTWYADFPDPDNFLGTLFHSKSKYNYTAYHNPEVDRLIEKARRERDYLKRMELYRTIEKIVLEDAPVIPMVNHLFQMVYQPYVRGVDVNALGGPYVPMKKIWLEKERNSPANPDAL